MNIPQFSPDLTHEERDCVLACRAGDFTVTEHIAGRTIALPFFNRMTDEEIETVCNALASAISTLSLQKLPVAA